VCSRTTNAPTKGPRGTRCGKFLQLLELVEDAEILGQWLGVLCELIDRGARDVAEEGLCHCEVLQPVRVDLHQACRGGVDRDRVVAEDEHTAAFRIALDRSVAFHTDDAVDDREALHAQRTVYVDDALRDAFPVQRVLRPAVDRARHDSEHVLHGQRGARPVVGLELGHGDQHVGIQHCVRQQ